MYYFLKYNNNILWLVYRQKTNFLDKNNVIYSIRNMEMFRN